MAIDLTHRIIQTPTPSAPTSSLRWHPWRRLLQVLCGVLLVGLPLTNGMRLDIRRHEFYFLWHKMAAHDLFMLSWVALLGVWALVVVSVLHGRLWCGWVCPQTLASDFAVSLRTRLDKAFRAKPAHANWYLSRGIWSLVLLTISLGTGITIACYWFAPGTAWSAAWHPEIDLGAALTVYGVTLLVAADMLWVRRRFCSDGCPYGALMGLLGDTKTLAVRYLDERDDDCIRCGKCVTDCPMDIDIKQGVGQLSCIGCGECVDACNDVLGLRGKPGLIEFRYGTDPVYERLQMTPAQRWGLWDGKRLGITAGLLIGVGTIAWLLLGPGTVAASVLANGSITYNRTSVRNTYELTIENGSSKNHRYTISLRGLPNGRVETPLDDVAVDGREMRTLPLTIACPIASAAPGSRASFQIEIRDMADHAEVSTIFYRPKQ